MPLNNELADEELAGEEEQGFREFNMELPPLDESRVYNYNLISNNTLENNDSDFDIYLHSTELDDRLEYDDDNQTNEDPFLKLAHAIINHTNSIRDSSLLNENTRFVNRITPAKYLPTFTGDPLDWLHFKQAYDMSTKFGEYTERKNIMRLFEALKVSNYNLEARG